MEVKLFDWHSKRAHYARYGKALSPWIFMLELLTALLLVFGVFFLVISMALGWAFIGIAAIPAMIIQWYKYELRDVPADVSKHSIDARMDGELLALIPQQATPKQLALALMHVNGGLFFEVRFGVGGGFLKEVASDDSQQVDVIFELSLIHI